MSELNSDADMLPRLSDVANVSYVSIQTPRNHQRTKNM